MSTKPSRSFSGIMIKTSIFAGVLLGSYYVGWVRPRLELPNALAAAEDRLASLHANLLQNRLTLIELTRIDPTDTRVTPARADLLARLAATNKDGQDLVNESFSLPRLTGAPTPPLVFINSDLPEALADTTERHRSILTAQRQLIEDITALDAVIGQLFEYNAAADLGSLTLPDQQAELAARAHAAAAGLENMHEELAAHEALPRVPSLRRRIEQLNERFVTLYTETENGRFDAAEAARAAVLSDVTAVQREALEAELALLRSPQSVALLVDQTNLLLEYRHWLRRAGEY